MEHHVPGQINAVQGGWKLKDRIDRAVFLLNGLTYQDCKVLSPFLFASVSTRVPSSPLRVRTSPHTRTCPCRHYALALPRCQGDQPGIGMCVTGNRAWIAVPSCRVPNNQLCPPPYAMAGRICYSSRSL
jgi:hypothetical protein